MSLSHQGIVRTCHCSIHPSQYVSTLAIHEKTHMFATTTQCKHTSKLHDLYDANCQSFIYKVEGLKQVSFLIYCRHKAQLL